MTTGRAFGVFLATAYAGLVTVTVHVRRQLHIGLALLIIIGLVIGSHLTGIWLLNERPAELEEKFRLAAMNAAKGERLFRIARLIDASFTNLEGPFPGRVCVRQRSPELFGLPRIPRCSRNCNDSVLICFGTANHHTMVAESMDS
jgi:hypothetical protein